MGYSHYVECPRGKFLPVNKFALAVRDCALVIEHYNLTCEDDDELVYARDEPDLPAQCDAEGVHFNGKGDKGYETFSVERSSMSISCKTDRRPYDLAVCACLIVFHHHLKKDFQVTSDGDDEEETWTAARRMCEELFGFGEDFTLYPRFAAGGLRTDTTSPRHSHVQHWLCSGVRVDVGKRGYFVDEAENGAYETAFVRHRVWMGMESKKKVCVVRYINGRGWERYALSKTLRDGRWLGTVGLIEMIAVHEGAVAREIAPFVERMKERSGDWNTMMVFADWLDDMNVSSKRIRILLPKLRARR